MTERISKEETATAIPSDEKKSGWLGLLLRLLIPVVFLALGTYGFMRLSKQEDKPAPPPAKAQPIRTNVLKVSVEDYTVTIKTNGILQAHNEVALNSQVSGQIACVSPAFEVGAYFKKGETLVELDASDYENSVAVAHAQYLGAWSALQLATTNLERSRTLYKMNIGSEAEFNRSTAVREQAAATLDSATAQVERSKRDLSRTQIVAPFDGRVREKAIGEGQTVGTGTRLGTVFAIDFAEVRLPISARELKFLKLPELASDPPVDVVLRSGVGEATDDVWHAKIVRTEGTLDEDSLALFAIARIDDPFGQDTGLPPLRIGQPLVASISGDVLQNVIAIPRTAVRQLNQVSFVDDGELTLINKVIKRLWSDEDHIIVRDESIKDGDLLATTRLVVAPDGAKVEIIPDINKETTTLDPEPTSAK